MKKFLMISFLFTLLLSCDNGETDTNSDEIEKVPVNLSLTDVATGWASYTGNTDLAGGSVTPPDSEKGTDGGYGGTVVTVSTRAELLNYAAKSGPYIIYIDGMIDMSEGMLPTTYNGSTSALDSFIASKTSGTAHPVSNYAQWKTEYAANVVSTADQSGSIETVRNTLNNAWGNIIKLSIASNKTIIGTTAGAGIKGGNIMINGVQNVIIRNLIVEDSYNPFPKMEKDDGYNADFDCVSIRSSKYIWIDHCTLKSSFTEFDHVTPSDGATSKNKWQVYDGLLDITNKNDFVTVSWCKLIDHDKTMLIGSSSSATDELKHQTITLHHNYYLGCTQRLPMVRFATIHIYNNLYEMNNKLSNNYAIGVREQVSIVAQNNNFSSGIKYSYNNSDGKLYRSGDVDNSYGGFNSKASSSMSWNPSTYYNYTLDNAEDIPTIVKNGAGATLLSK